MEKRNKRSNREKRIEGYYDKEYCKEMKKITKAIKENEISLREGIKRILELKARY